MSKKLTEMTLVEFNEVLASKAPAPGGGSVAALEGALGASLVAMVCQLSMKKIKEDAENKEELEALNQHYRELEEKAHALALKLQNAIDSDTDAFTLVSNAFAMPKGTPEEKAARSKAIQEGLLECTKSPYHMLELLKEGVELAETLSEKFNTNTASDLAVGALSMVSAARGAWMNVLINVGSLKDQEVASEYQKKAMALKDEVAFRGKALYEKLEAGLLG